MQIHELPEYSGDPATNDVFPIDTGTHTFKLPFAELGEAIITTVSATISGVSQTVKAAIEAVASRVSTLEQKTADISFSDDNNLTTINGHATVTGDLTAGSTGIQGGGSARVYVLTQNVNSALIGSNQTGHQGFWNYKTNKWVWYAAQDDVLITNNRGASNRPPVLSEDTNGARIGQISSTASGLWVGAQYGTAGVNYDGRFISVPQGSDRRLKTNIKPTEKSGLDLINSLDIVQFDWKDGSGHWDFGIIAQDAGKLDENIPAGEETEETYLTLNTMYLVDILLKAVQELSAKVEALENER